MKITINKSLIFFRFIDSNCCNNHNIRVSTFFECKEYFFYLFLILFTVKSYSISVFIELSIAEQSSSQLLKKIKMRKIRLLNFPH